MPASDLPSRGAGLPDNDRPGPGDRAERPPANGWSTAPAAPEYGTFGALEPGVSYPPSRQHREQSPGRRDTSDAWRAEPDSGSWNDDARPNAWRGARQYPADEGWSTDDRPGKATWGSGNDRLADDTGWRADEDSRPGGSGWRDAGAEAGRAYTRPATDPWAQNAADSGVIPLSWEQPAADTASWRSPDGWPQSARRGPWDDGPTARVSEAWRDRYREGAAAHSGEPDAGVYPGTPDAGVYPGAPDVGAPAQLPTNGSPWESDPRPPAPQPGPNDAVTEIRQRIDPDQWHRPGEPPAGWQNGRSTPVASPSWENPPAAPAAWDPAGSEPGAAPNRGPATYRSGDSADWQRDLAMRSDLTEGESRRYGTEDFRPRPDQRRPGGNTGPLFGGSRDRAEGSDDSWPFGDTPDRSEDRHRTVGAYSTGFASGGSVAVDDGDAEDNGGGALAAVGYTIIWYGVPVALFVFYVLVFGSSDQAHALTALSGAAPQFGLSLVVSIVVAVVLRWMISSWRAWSVGLAAAVLGGGLATVLVSAITGHSLT